MTDNGDRLNRIEAVLEGLTQNLVHLQEQSQQQFAEADHRLTRIEEGLTRMEQAQERNQQFAEADQRLTRIEQLQAQNALEIAQLRAGIAETRKIADSNARSIQALGNTVTDDRAERKEIESEFQVGLNAIRQTLNQTSELQQTLLNLQIRDRDEWRQQRADVNQQIQALIDNQNQDRQTWRQQIQSSIETQNRDRQDWRQQSNEINQQIQLLIDSQNQDRQAWRQQNNEINQQIQSLINLSRENTQAHAELRADIQQIWDRLAG